MLLGIPLVPLAAASVSEHRTVLQENVPELFDCDNCVARPTSQNPVLFFAGFLHGLHGLQGLHRRRRFHRFLHGHLVIVI